MMIGPLYCLALWTCAATVIADNPAIDEGTARIPMKKADNMATKRSHDTEYRRQAGFSWSKCTTSSSVVDVQTLSIAPDPLVFPGNVDVSSEFTINKQVHAPLKADVVLWQLIGSTFVKIPCLDKFGSCTYDDVCEILASIADHQCPDILQMIDINCHCPFLANSYMLSHTLFDIESSPLPQGDYRLGVNFTQNYTNVLCLDLNFSVE